MNKYIKNGIVLDRKHIVINKNGKQIIGASEDILFSDGWIKYEQPSLSKEELLLKAKEELRSSIINYDSSDNVNEFIIGDDHIWLDKSTRSGLMLRLQAEKANNLPNTTLWEGNKQYNLDIDVAIQMLYTIELYASACYDNTQNHLAEVDKLTTLEDVKNYDYTVGYPNKLIF